jgi:hypothetical protein
MANPTAPSLSHAPQAMTVDDAPSEAAIQIRSVRICDFTPRASHSAYFISLPGFNSRVAMWDAFLKGGR